ncbi:MAG TPA: hypothetical protein VJN22_01475 [Candidatus Eremiobacteraceae bacterium]|nr:hypothetical protein [Candidatus Eremiobacteraceae bacterium]
MGPAATGGRVAAVAGSATDPNLYYLGAAGGGVWKSDNGGATWDPVFDDQDVQSIGAVTIAPSDDKTVWVGSGEANPRNDVLLGTGVFKSTDAGGSWKKMGLPSLQSISRIVVDPKNVNHVVVGGLGDLFKDSQAGGVYETTDGGKTWTHTLFVGASSGASDLAMDMKNPNVIYAGMWQFRRQPWTATSGGPDDGLYKSVDGGASWTKLAGHGLPSGLQGRIGLAIAPSDSSRVYALIQSKEGFLYRSDDAGATWTMVNNDTLIDQRPFYFSHIAVDPANKDNIYSVSFAAALSKDGGKTFKVIADPVHVDFHAIWIAPNDGKRIIVGEDGGAPVTVDGGKNWVFSANYPIGQIYHIAADDANPYTVCGGFQDNNGWCWPSNSRDSDGITNAYATPVVGGDGQWIVPDPAKPDNVWADSQDGFVSVWMNKARISYGVFPDLTCFNGFAIDKCKYRFNWDSPIAFAPWDPHTVWYGGNVVFQSHDEGRHWTAISPDLTLNIKSHQQASGGPINLDISGAETSDNILDIEGGTFGRGDIWVGTDDGLIQLTRDGGKHWANVTPPGIPPFGRVETIAPSTLTAGTAFAVFDRHYSGDYAPYVFKTTNFGKSWTSLAAGLPKDQPARTVRQDPVNADVLYAGLERSMWISFDDGRKWQSLQLNLPHAAVFDLRFQTRFDDMIIATHGRSAWVMDDIRPLQQLEAARAAGHFVFQPPIAYQYNVTEKAEGNYSNYGGDNPPAGAIIDFFQTKAGGKAPTIAITDSRGRLVRHYAGKHAVGTSGKKVAWITNESGVNRFVWDFSETPITPWYGAANKRARLPNVGGVIVPGQYTARVTFSNGQTLSRMFTVRPDPDAPWTQAQYEEGYRFGETALSMLDNMDKGLNSIDAQIVRLKKLKTSQATAAAQEGAALESSLSANYKNDEDSIMFPPKVREDVQGLVFASGAGPVLAVSYQAAGIVKTEYEQAMARIDSWLARARTIT